jgi:biopolymer transport protein ExbB
LRPALSWIGIFSWVCLNLFCASSFAAEGETPAPASASFFSIVFSGGPVGIGITVLLLLLSLTTAYLIFDHLLSIRRRDLIPEGLPELVQQALANGDIKAAQQACSDRPSMLSFVLLQGISDIEFGWSSVEKTLEESLAEQSARLFRKLEYLSVIANVGPMLGLLGTVTGMIMAFRQVAETQGTASAPQLAEGIYSALVTTVLGLMIAIPAIGAFAVFRNRIDQFVAEAAYLAQHVFTPLRRKAKLRKES